jgi:hypothetical protein
MKTYPVRPGSTVTAYALKRLSRPRWRPVARISSRPATIERPRLRVGCCDLAASFIALPWRDRSGENQRVDNREIVTILRGALMDLAVAFQTIERQIHAAPERRSTSSQI